MSKFNNALKHGEEIEKQRIVFNKNSLSLEEQIVKLKTKGMLISNEQKTKTKLSIINYYRFESYWFPFYNFEIESFISPISFDFIMNYYRFDNEFRMLLFKSITYIEIAFRTQFAYNLSLKYGPHALLNKQLFTNKYNWDNYIERSKKSYETYNEKFIDHFKEKYVEDLPPIWAHVELMTFGDLINWWYLLGENKDKKEITNIFKLKASIYDIKIWFDNIRVIRNYCAHHSRLWNRAFAKSIKNLKKGNNSIYSELWNTDNKKSRRIFYSLILIDHLLSSINIEEFRVF